MSTETGVITVREIKFPFVFLSIVFAIAAFIFGIFLGKNGARTTVYVAEASTLPPVVTEAPSPPPQISGITANGEKVNINTATVQELDQLPGIGEAIAQRIVDYRLENGYFLAIEELMEVSGIGEKMFAQIRDLITVR